MEVEVVPVAFTFLKGAYLPPPACTKLPTHSNQRSFPVPELFLGGVFLPSWALTAFTVAVAGHVRTSEVGQGSFVA